MSRVLGSMSVVLLLTGCGSSAGVPAVVTSVEGIEVTCRSETRLPTAEACRDWGQDLLDTAPNSTSVVITLHPAAGPCEADFFVGDHLVESATEITCREP